MDNAETEHTFISTFFGQHSSLPVLPTSSPTLFSEPSSETPSEASVRAPSIREPSALDRDRQSSVDGESIFGSESGRSVGGTPATKKERGEKLRKAVVDGIWKSILEPAQEYVRVRRLSLEFARWGRRSYLAFAELCRSPPRSYTSLSRLPPHHGPPQRKRDRQRRYLLRLPTDGEPPHRSAPSALADRKSVV